MQSLETINSNYNSKYHNSPIKAKMYLTGIGTNKNGWVLFAEVYESGGKALGKKPIDMFDETLPYADVAVLRTKTGQSPIEVDEDGKPFLTAVGMAGFLEMTNKEREGELYGDFWQYPQ